MSARQLHHHDAQLRHGAAVSWLQEQASDQPLQVLASSTLALDALWREVVPARGGAVLGWSRQTLAQRALQLAEPSMRADGVWLASRAALESVLERALAVGFEGSEIGPLLGAPGLHGAALDALLELRASGGELSTVPLLLQNLHAAYESQLSAQGWIDRPELLRRAIAAVGAQERAPLLVYDVWPQDELEVQLLRALQAHASGALSIWPVGCWRAQRAALGEPWTTPEERSSLASCLFAESSAGAETLPELRVASAPGEAREALELARMVAAEAARGVPFARIAVALREPSRYLLHLRDAFERAQIPWHSPGGVPVPDPQGRALLELLHCAREGLSAERFMAYLALRTVPRQGPREVAPRPSLDPVQAERLQARAEQVEPALATEERDEAAWWDELSSSDPAPPVLAWQRMIVEARVIGSRARFRSRLASLEQSLQAACEKPGASTSAQAIWQACRALRTFAEPLLDQVQALSELTQWSEWLPALRVLCASALSQPESVLAVLDQLQPLASIEGGRAVSLDAVLRRLEPLLGQRQEASPPAHGAVLCASPEQLLGLCFEVVFVPGVAERMFPARLVEQPLWPDRDRLAVEGAANSHRRAEDERLRLRIALGAAQAKVVMSYPRLDVQSIRPRSPSLYLLEAWRAVHGDLPRADVLARAAAEALDARLGWPAPAEPLTSLDEVEHDLSVLAELLLRDDAGARGGAAYLLASNPHLARALRARAERWHRKRWYSSDGLRVEEALGEQALSAHQIDARSFSPTALQHYAACPYRFYLQAVLRLQPRELPQASYELDPLQRGTFVHEVLFRFLQRVHAEGQLPFAPDDAPRWLPVIDEVLDQVAESLREEIAPAIERVWQDQLAELRADVHEWLRRQCQEQEFTPAYFELAFGLSDRQDERDARSQDAPVELDCGLRLRGSIDLVERDRQGVLRATDYKTGQVRTQQGDVIKGGKALQPAMYALVLERLLAEGERHANVWGSQLSYCTHAGSYTEVKFPLTDAARTAATRVAEALDAGLRGGFLPAMPAKEECRFCDYRQVCGPHEAVRSGRKPGAAPEVSLRTKPPAATSSREAHALYTLGVLRREP